MKTYLRSISNMSQNFQACPKKYLTLLGSLICFMAIGSISITSTASPYYLSYLQVKTGSSLARYPNSIYLSSALGISDAISAIIGGFLMNKYKLTMKQMFFIGSIISWYISALYL